MGMMGMFKWLRKDVIQRDRNGWNSAPMQSALNNESYRNALQAFIDRRRLSDDATADTDTPSSPDKKRADFYAKNNNNKKCDNEWKSQDLNSIAGVPHIRPSEIFEIGWVAGTEDRYLELIFAEWQNTRVSLKRHTHPECKDAVKADLDVLSEIQHPNVLLLMATTQTDDHGLVSIFESVDCTLYNYLHEQGERISIQGIAKCGGKLSDALRHSHMRGFVHGAISSHCIYLASSGIVKIGGWELAGKLNNSKPQREYEERLRNEIFRWLAPELYCGYQPTQETDVYGLTMLIWEMCTMDVPWSGCSKTDVERQYMHWKRGVMMDLHDFPPLLNNLLEAGLQLDVTKRTLDMNRMRRFLQTLEMQYEDEEPVYIEQYADNNNESAKTYLLPTAKSPGNSSKSKRLTKSASAKQLSYPHKDTDSPSKQYLTSKRMASKKNASSKIAAHIEPVNFFDCPDNIKRKDEIQKNTNVLYSVQNNQRKINPLNSKHEYSDNIQSEDHNLKEILQPWNNTYKKVKVPRGMLESRSTSASVYSISSPPLESTDDESYKDARTSLRHLKEVLANKREHFFYGSDSSHGSLDTNPTTKNEILTRAKSKDYEPHKPASHKTSLEPKYNKSPGQYDPSYMKPSSQHCRKVPYSHTAENIKDAILQRQILNPDTASFFETSLWRKEKLICISKMRKTEDTEEAAYLVAQHPTTTTIVDSMSTRNQCRELHSPESDNTYIINSKSNASDPRTRDDLSTKVSANISDATEIISPRDKPLQTLKDALDRATEIVRCISPNTDESCPTSPFKMYSTFDVRVDDAHIRKTIFEDMYNLKATDETQEIRSIEKTINDNDTFLMSTDDQSNATSNIEDASRFENEVNINVTSCDGHSSYDATFTRNFVCESIAEVSSEFNTSANDTQFDKRDESYTDKGNATAGRNDITGNIITSTRNTIQSETETSAEVDVREKKSVVTKLTLMLLNDGTKCNKNCNSCHQSALPRRRSLPAALSQLRGINNSALGKLPIRKGDARDSTVEDLYIDDEFGDSLNVNMVLLDEELSFDEDFLPDFSEL